MVNLFGFGQNTYGELCLGDEANFEDKITPTAINSKSFHSFIKQIVAGNEHTVVLLNNGEVYSCGYNDSGQCGTGNTIRVHELTLVEGFKGKKISSLYSANGCEHLCAVSSDGILFTNGYNSRGQLGHNHLINELIPRGVESLFGKRVISVACSYYHTIAYTDEDLVYGWGRGSEGQLGIGECIDKLIPYKIEALSNKKIVSMSAGQYHSCFVTENGLLYTTGKNDFGQLGLLDAELKIIPEMITIFEKHITNVACGYYHTLCITSDGNVYSFGRNDFGQLGLGHKENVYSPTIIQALSHINIIQISSGCYHSIALGENGRVFPFGRNNHGQLGTNNIIDSTLPTVIENLRDVKISQIAAGFYHTILLETPPSDNFSSMSSYSERSLSSDLGKLLNNELTSDFAFIIEGKKIYAHRCIISSRCEPLDKMLYGGMKESKMKEINLPEQNYHVFLALLEFLYTDTVICLSLKESVDISFTLDLLSLADQFLIEKLKKLCEASTERSINIDNVCMMLDISDKRGAVNLRRTCFDFIFKHFGKVIANASFIQLPQKLLQEILLTASKRGVYLKS